MQDHYDIEPSDDGLSYSFITKHDIKYIVALVIYPIGEISAFSLSLDLDEGFDPAPGLDFKIKNTCSKIISDILLNDSNTVFYVCENLDGKSEKRHKAFEHWFDTCKGKYDHVGKLNHQFTSVNQYVINSSLLFNVANPLMPQIIEWFKEVMNEM